MGLSASPRLSCETRGNNLQKLHLHKLNKLRRGRGREIGFDILFGEDHWEENKTLISARKQSSPDVNLTLVLDDTHTLLARITIRSILSDVSDQSYPAVGHSGPGITALS